MAGLVLELDPSRIISGANQAESALESIATQAGQTQTAINNMGSRAVAPVNNLAGAFSRFGSHQVANVANQIGDFATQVGSGTDASRALGQQLPQLLGGFGVMGAVAGGVAAIAIPALRVALEQLGIETVSLDDAMEDLEGSISDLRRANRAAETDIEDLTEQYGSYAAQLRDVLLAEQEVAAYRAQQSLRTAMGAISGEVGAFDVTPEALADLDAYLEGINARRNEISRLLATSATAEEIPALREELERITEAGIAARAFPDAMAELGSQLGITTDAATDLAEQIQVATDAETAREQAAAFAAMRDILEEAGAEMGGMTSEAVDLIANINTAETAAIELAAIEMANLERAAQNAERIRRALSSVPALSGPAGSLLPNAHGNVFSGGNIIPFARGGVVSGPTLFGMAGASTGLMGEAGPEAIMPLVRGPNGDLGVQAFGGGVTAPGVDAAADSMGEFADETERANDAWDDLQRVGGSAIDRLIDGSINLKDALTEMLLEFVKAMTMQNLVNRGFAQPGESIGGAIFRSFMGLFDNGGSIPAGRWGIAGEYGPEIVSGPATVTSRAQTARVLGQPAEVRVTGGNLTLTDDGRIAAQIQVAAVTAQETAVRRVRGSLAGWNDELSVHGALA